MRRLAEVCVVINWCVASVAVADGPLLTAPAWDAPVVQTATTQPQPATGVGNVGDLGVSLLPAYEGLTLSQDEPVLNPSGGSGGATVEPLPSPVSDPVISNWPMDDVVTYSSIIPGADNGTNPAANIRNWSLSNEFIQLQDAGNFNATVLSLRFPLLEGRGGLRFDLPYCYFDSDFGNSAGGFADLRFLFNYDFYSGERAEWTIMPLLEFYVPTKDEDWFSTDLLDLKVGYRRFVLGPGVGFVRTLQPNSFVALLYNYSFDVAGSSGDDVSSSKLIVEYMYSWESGWYMLPEFGIFRDFEHNNDRDMLLGSEIGYSSCGTTYYLFPAIGIDKSFGDREWGIGAGVRVLY
jgi:hypothetical protein